MKNVLVLGATSDIARAFSIRIADRGDQFILAARNEEELKVTAADLRIRSGATVGTLLFDAEKLETMSAVRKSALNRLERIDVVVLAFGYLGEQDRAQQDAAEAARIVTVSLTAAIAAIEPLAAYFEERGRGWILAFSSVAGVRGRRKNYIYGAAKSGLTTYLEGLAHRVSQSGVKVKIAKLGFVASKMTRGQSMPKLLVTTPEHVARRLDWFLHSPFQSAYIPWRWWPVMTLLRVLPAFLFNRMGTRG